MADEETPVDIDDEDRDTPVSETQEPEVEQEDERDRTGANKFDVDVAKAQARKEMWRTVQKLFDNVGKIGGLIGLLLAGYATCAKASKTETEEKLREQSGAINDTANELEKTKEATIAVRDYTSAVASSASAAVVAVASAATPPIMISNKPKEDGCWVSPKGGIVRCGKATVAELASAAKPKPAAPAMKSPPAPELAIDEPVEPAAAGK